MPLLISRVLWNEVEVFSADDKGSVHLRRYNSACENTSANGDLTCEGTLLILTKLTQIHINPHSQLSCCSSQSHTDVASFNCSLWCSEPKTYILVPSPAGFPS